MREKTHMGYMQYVLPLVIYLYYRPIAEVRLVQDRSTPFRF